MHTTASLKVLARASSVYNNVNERMLFTKPRKGPPRQGSKTTRKPYRSHRTGNAEQNRKRFLSSGDPAAAAGEEAPSIDEAELLVDELASEQNETLLVLLQKEKDRERERQRVLQQLPEDRRAESQAQFEQERLRAMQLVRDIAQEHETALHLRMTELGLEASTLNRPRAHSMSPTAHAPARA